MCKDRRRTCCFHPPALQPVVDSQALQREQEARLRSLESEKSELEAEAGKPGLGLARTNKIKVQLKAVMSEIEAIKAQAPVMA